MAKWSESKHMLTLWHCPILVVITLYYYSKCFGCCFFSFVRFPYTFRLRLLHTNFTFLVFFWSVSSVCVYEPSPTFIECIYYLIFFIECMLRQQFQCIVIVNIVNYHRLMYVIFVKIKCLFVKIDVVVVVYGNTASTESKIKYVISIECQKSN